MGVATATVPTAIEPHHDVTAIYTGVVPIVYKAVDWWRGQHPIVFGAGKTNPLAPGMLSALFIDALGPQRGALVFDTLLTALGAGIAWRAWSRLRSQA